MTQSASQQQAAPTDSRLRAIVLGAGARANVADQADAVRQTIEQFADVVVWDLAFSEDLSAVDADVVIVLGGDGSILRAAGQMGYTQRPIVGVNMGKLGFLADHSPAELPDVLTCIAKRQHYVVEHLMFECCLHRDGKVLAKQLGLNEVALRAGTPFNILDVDLYVDEEWVTTYSCDGLIISTPVGSTAHCLSAGGPILRKDLQAFVILPISPHTLTNRPVVDSAARHYRFEVPHPEQSTSLVVDGGVVARLQAGDKVSVSKAEPNFQLVKVPGHSYYRTLREKLGWGGRLTRPEDH